MHSTGTFELTPLPPTPGPIGRMAFDKKFSGDLEATSRVEMLTAMTEVKGSAAYVAIEHVTGKLGGRAGAFFLHHTGIMNRGVQQLSIAIVPDSGTGELLGISGTLQIRIEAGQHFYDLDYALGR